MDYAELTTKAVEELRELLAAEEHRLRELTFQAREMQLKNVRAVRVSRRAVAQIQTALGKATAKAA